MRGFLRLVVANPVAVVLLVVVAVLGGVFALFHLPVGLFPELNAPVVNIITHYPGAAAEDIEILITRPIEDRIRTLPGIRRVASTSGEGLSMITAQFTWGTSLTSAHQLVQTQVSSVQSELPPGVSPRLENIGTRSVLLCDMASVRFGAAPRHYQVHGNGRNAVAFLVSKQPHASTIAVARGVEAELARTRTLLPAGAQVRKFYDQAEIIPEARRSLFHDLVGGAVLAAAVLFSLVGTMRLTPRAGRRRTLEQVMDSLRHEYDKIPGVVFLYHQPTQEKMDESLSGLPAAFGVTIFGLDESELVSLAARIERIMVEDPALGNIINNPKVRTPQIVIQPDPVELARCGLSPRTIFDTVQASRFGALATTVIRQRSQVQVLVRLEPPREATLTWLPGLALPTSQGHRVPLSQVADIHVAHRPAAITRLNGQREVTILAEVSGSIPATMDRLRRAFASIRLPEGYSIAFTGQYKVIGRTTLDFVTIGLAAILLIYLIMTMQFGSWLQPLIVLTTVPPALVGAIVLLAATRVGLDVSVGMGALTLVGIAVNNAIVLVDYANRQGAAGQPVRTAVSTAVSVRLRPIPPPPRSLH